MTCSGSPLAWTELEHQTDQVTTLNKILDQITVNYFVNHNTIVLAPANSTGRVRVQQ